MLRSNWPFGCTNFKIKCYALIDLKERRVYGYVQRPKGVCGWLTGNKNKKINTTDHYYGNKEETYSCIGIFTACCCCGSYPGYGLERIKALWKRTLSTSLEPGWSMREIRGVTCDIVSGMQERRGSRARVDEQKAFLPASELSTCSLRAFPEQLTAT